MRLYNYFLFRLYFFYTDVFKEKQIPLFYVGAVSTLTIAFTLFAIYDFVSLYNDFPSLSNYSIIVIGCMFIIWLVNHVLFIRKKKFLTEKFRKDYLGGVLIIAYWIIMITALIIVANIHRSRL